MLKGPREVSETLQRSVKYDTKECKDTEDLRTMCEDRPAWKAVNCQNNVVFNQIQSSNTELTSGNTQIRWTDCRRVIGLRIGMACHMRIHGRRQWLDGIFRNKVWQWRWYQLKVPESNCFTSLVPHGLIFFVSAQNHSEQFATQESSLIALLNVWTQDFLWHYS